MRPRERSRGDIAGAVTRERSRNSGAVEQICGDETAGTEPPYSIFSNFLVAVR